MAKTKYGNFIGMFFQNSNAQQLQIKFAKDGDSRINFRTVGGILDIFFFMGGTADDVV